MKVIVTYVSETGNTKKVAEAIFEEIKGRKGLKSEIKPMSEVNSLDSYELAFIGFPMAGRQAPEDINRFLEQHAKGKNIALFITHGSPEDLPELKEWLSTCEAAAASSNLLGVFNCQGEMSQALADFMATIPDPWINKWAKTRPLTIGQPDVARLKRARSFAMEILKKYAGT